MANSSMRDLKVGDFTLDGRKDKKTNYKNLKEQEQMNFLNH